MFSKDQSHKQGSARNAELSAGKTGSPCLIGRETTIEGAIRGTENVLVEGIVRGEIDLQSDLRVGRDARVESTVHARSVYVEGTVIGNVSADEKVELMASAVVDGNIRAPKIVVAEGARFRGSVDMGADPATS
ncbi:MAG TPA: polymer-forming cytoskeletal protein [Thermoanaerobaculia bacterium]|nr:polymer-forming cytoskeletal protein [Thermoanaerobaculia bacterium]